jgi:predicted AAA+ superfamily ATPase
MKSNEIMEILTDWNFWGEELDTGIERPELLKEMQRLLKINEILVVSGVRRSGKSTLVLQFCKSLIESGVRKEDILIVNLEDPRFKQLDLQLLNEIYETYLTQLNPSKEHYVVLDEVQVVKQWEKYARFLHENRKAHVIVTGSSSKLLSSEYATVLAGRHVDMQVYPLSFKEFLRFKGVDIKTNIEIISKRHQIKRLMQEYLKWGGFPKPTLLKKEKEKKDELYGYFRDIMTKDVAMRYKVKDIGKLEELAKYYLSNIASLQSFNNIKKFLDISLDSVERFSTYFSNAYLLFFVKKFSYSVKQQILNPRKVYCIDTGLRKVAGFVFMEDLGKLMENTVFVELMRKGKQVFYWKNKGEVDFVIKGDKKVEKLIQVCYDAEDPKTKEREVNALLEAMKFFKLRTGVIVTWDYEDEERINGKKISYIPIWKWLLQP